MSVAVGGVPGHLPWEQGEEGASQLEFGHGLANWIRQVGFAKKPTSWDGTRIPALCRSGRSPESVRCRSGQGGTAV
jgi:hypothetical protein